MTTIVKIEFDFLNEKIEVVEVPYEVMKDYFEKRKKENGHKNSIE